MQSEEKARRVIQFIECLRHTKGEFHGQPFKLLPWQEKIIRAIEEIASILHESHPYAGMMLSAELRQRAHTTGKMPMMQWRLCQTKLFSSTDLKAY